MESFQEVIHLQEQIIDCKKQCTRARIKNQPTVSIVIVANKSDRDSHRVIKSCDIEKFMTGKDNCVFVEASAKKNKNIDDVFKKLFLMARLPAEMSPSLHRKVTPTYESHSQSSQQSVGRLVSIRRKMSDACGAVALNVRRPSIRTDLLTAQARTNQEERETGHRRERRCMIQ